MSPVLAMMLFSAYVADHPFAWNMQSEASTLTFTANYDGGGFSGRFDEFDVALLLDPDDLGSASLTVTIDATSINTDNEERDETLATDEWFSFSEHPEAIYQATGFELLSTGGWAATGSLTLKGITQPVRIDFGWEQQAGGDLSVTGRARMTGDAEVDRSDFAIGEGDWADPSLIGHEVFVEFDLSFSRGSASTAN